MLLAEHPTDQVEVAVVEDLSEKLQRVQEVEEVEVVLEVEVEEVAG